MSEYQVDSNIFMTVCIWLYGVKCSSLLTKPECHKIIAISMIEIWMSQSNCNKYDIEIWMSQKVWLYWVWLQSECHNNYDCNEYNCNMITPKIWFIMSIIEIWMSQKLWL